MSTTTITDGASGPASSTVVATVEITKDSTPSTHASRTLKFTLGPGSAYAKDLASGANTITTHATTCGVWVQMPSTNTATVTLKGVSGDTGIPQQKKGWFFVTLATAGATFVITTGGTIANVEFIEV